MEQRFLQQRGNSRLILFFSGWGGDECLFNHPLHPDYDYLLCFDYTQTDFDANQLAGYKEITLIGWSMGVYMAALTLSAYDSLPIVRRIAINGTMTPKHDDWGIPRVIFEQTLMQLSPIGLVKFRRRMCGNTAQVAAFLSHRPYRSLESLRSELAALNERVDAQPAPPFRWDEAIIGEYDLIIASEQQLKAWAGVSVRLLPIAHYDEQLIAAIFSNPESLWTRS